MRKSIAIVGGGPAGCTLAIFLKRRGHKVAIFDGGKKADIFVGESLIPALVPLLRELGIEEEVSGFSVYKPGASVWVDECLCSNASFDGGMGYLPPYSYNTNRKKFDELLLETAVKEGVTIFPFRAEVEAKGDSISLKETILKKCEGFFSSQPDFFVDASGRKRLFSNLLKLPFTRGERDDTALFAHVEKQVFAEYDGDIHMHLATKGWCWRIPQKETTSVGIVVDKQKLKEFGGSFEEQFDNYLVEDPKLNRFFTDTKRLTKVQKYSNYQLQSNRIVGANWALVGDAAGFLDPVFSSGLYFSMKYAQKLAEVIDSKRPKAFDRYQKQWEYELGAWKTMIELWYNGRLFTNFKMGNDRLDTFIGKRIGKHAIKHFTAIFTGEAVLNKYSMWLLGFMTGPLLDFMRKMRMHEYDIKDLEL